MKQLLDRAVPQLDQSLQVVAYPIPRSTGQGTTALPRLTGSQHTPLLSVQRGPVIHRL